MKKLYLFLMIFMLCMIGVDNRQAKAYSVTVEKDGIYADVVPDSFVNNTAALFKKYVKKAMKYYDKYKDADDYTYVLKVPEEYRDFIPIAKQIQDADEIMIRNPFYIYGPGVTDETTVTVYDYSFYAVKNGKKLCMFSIHIEPGSGKVSFEYDKMWDSHFAYDEKTTGETLFYWVGDIIYAETQDSTSIVWDKRSVEGGNEMISASGTTDWKAVQEREDEKFRKKSYHEKKTEVMDYLAKGKKGQNYKKAEKNLKLELEDEYVEPEEDTEKSGRMYIYIVSGIAIVVIAVIIAVVMLRRKGKRE